MTALIRHRAASGVAAAFAAGLAALGLAAFGAPLVHAAWSACLFALLAGLAWTDALTETVPDVLTLGLVASGVAHAAASGADLAPIFAGGGLLLAAGVAQERLTGDRGWIGSGDFFLAAGILAWFGPVATLDVLAVTSAGLVLHALVARRTRTAVAPSLALGAAVIWVGGPIL